MTTPSLILLAPMMLVMGAMFVIAGCQSPSPTGPVAERPVVCNGRPDWCLVAKNDVDRPVYVHMDGKMSGVVLPGKARRLPATAGEKHLIDYCGFFDVADLTGRAQVIKQWRCSTPTAMPFEKGDLPMDLKPL